MSVPSERRQFNRYAIELRGWIGLAGERQLPCMVRDYCSGGMLIQPLPAGSAKFPDDWRDGQTVHLNTEFLTSSGSRPFRIPASIAWSRGSLLGLAFPKPSAAIVAALQRHDALARASDSSDAPSGPRRGEVRCLAKLGHVAKGLLPGLLRELILTTRDRLIERTDNAASDQEAQQLYTDIRALEGMQETDTLARSIVSRALDSVVERREQAKDEASELALVERDEFERWLEASRVSVLLSQKYADQISALGSRLAAIRSEAESQGLMVPFEPRHFTDSLSNLASELDLGVVSRGVLFDLTAELLGEKLGDFYARLDATLDELQAPAARALQNVTKLRASVKPAPKEDGHEAAQSGTAAEPGALSSAPGLAPAASTLAQGQNGTVMMPPGNAVAIDPALLSELLESQRAERHGQAREMVSLIGESPEVGGTLREWMEHLGEPLAREAAEDASFFRNTEHPLRELVDGLAHLQRFEPTGNKERATDELSLRLAQLLEVLRENQSDAKAVRAVADEVSDLTVQQSRRYQRNVERVAQASEGRDRVRRARESVVDEINSRYAGRKVPELMPELLDAGWRAVLELAWWNRAEGGDRFSENLETLDGLVARLHGEPFDSDLQPPDPRTLFETIQQELVSVSFDPFRRNALENQLRGALQDPSRVALIRLPKIMFVSASNTDDPPAGVTQAAWSRVVEQCRVIAVGDRVRMAVDNKGPQHLGVAWIRPDGGAFVVVDHRGLRVRELPLKELALGLHRREIMVEHSNGKPPSEQAVEVMLQRMEERLSYQAAHDSLTGLMNRQQFHTTLEQRLMAPGQTVGRGVLLWIDIDQFRLINDVHDYDTGDRLLVRLARQLEQVDGVGELGHLGGDRFALLLPDLSPEDGEQRAQEICAAIKELAFDWRGQPMGLSVSIGAAALSLAQNDLRKLLRAVENALTSAKAAGGDQVYVYREDDPDISKRQESVHWLAQVDEALDRGQLRLRCQPIVPVRPDRGLAPHYEVLLGVSGGSEESLPIAEFIDAAERYNRMRAVDRWVARTVIEWIKTHRQQMPALHGFAVNLSGQTASDPAFVDFVRKELARSGIEPAWLSFEVTETAAVSNLSSTAGIVHDLKSLGCKVALDDFGSGLASYSYLKELPVDWLKIDGVFVRKIAADRDDYAVVKSINEIGQFMGKKTIAEYVADDEILRLVRKIGVDYAQGFGVSPPILMDELLQIILPQRSA